MIKPLLHFITPPSPRKGHDQWEGLGWQEEDRGLCAQRVPTQLRESAQPWLSTLCAPGTVLGDTMVNKTDRQTGRRKPELRCQWGSSSLRVQVGKRRAEGHGRTGQHLNRGAWLGERSRAGFQRKQHPASTLGAKRLHRLWPAAELGVGWGRGAFQEEGRSAKASSQGI